MKASEVRRTKDLEMQVSRLEKIVARQALELMVAKEVISGEVVGPRAKRDAVGKILRKHERVTARSACGLLGLEP